MSTNRRRRQSYYPPVERLEDRVLLSAAPVLFTPGSDQTQPTEWGTIPPNSESLAIFFTPVMSLTSDIHGNPIDFNQDGRTDLVQGGMVFRTIGYPPTEQLVASSGTGIGEAYLANPSGGFTIIPGTNEAGQPKNFNWTNIAVLDLNGDGYQDILSVAPDSTVDLNIYDPVQNTFTKTVDVSTLIHAGYTGDSSVSMADVNNDGLPDLALPDYDLNHQLTGFSIFLAQAPAPGNVWGGQFVPDAYATVTIREPIPSLNNSTVGGGPANVQPVFADFSGDGKVDMAIPELHGVTIFVNPGNGQYSQGNSVFVNSSGSLLGFNLQAADFNNDGKMDLISSPNQISRNLQEGTLPIWNAVLGPVSVYLNTTPSGGSVAFNVSGIGPDNEENGFLQVGDFNLDGNVDIAMSFSARVGVNFAVATGDGQGNFSVFSHYSAYNNDDGFTSVIGHQVVSLGLGDFNGDGQLDVAASAATFGNNAATFDQYAVGILGVSYNRTFDNPGVKPTTLPAGTVAQPYSQQLTFTGGDDTKPYVITVSPNGNPLPAGLVLSPTGLISGTPTQRGPFQITFHVTQANGLAGDTMVNLLINPVSSATITINPATLPTAAVNTPYSQQLTTTGQTGAVTFSVTAGLLPNGLTLSSTGLISGTPTAMGTYGFTVFGIDPNGAYGSRTYSLQIGNLALSGLPQSGYFVQGTPRLEFASGLVVSQASGLNLLSATVSFVNWQAGDRLDFYNSYFPFQHTMTQDLVTHTAVLTLTGSASAALYQSTLRTLMFYNVAGNPNSGVTRVATISVADPYLSASASENLGVFKYLAGLNSNMNYVQGAPPLPIAENLVVTPPQGVTSILNATVSFVNWQAGDRVTFYNSFFPFQHTFTEDLVAHTASLSLTGAATAMQYQLTLNTVMFYNVAVNPNAGVTRVATFTVNDGSNTASATQNLRIIPVNSPPVVQVNDSSTLSYSVNTTPIAIMGLATITDADSNNLTSLTVQITSGYQANHDILSFTDQSGITGVFNPLTGMLTLSGSSYVGYYREALRSVKFNTTGSGVNLGQRIFTVIATDEQNLKSTPVSRALNVTA